MHIFKDFPEKKSKKPIKVKIPFEYIFLFFPYFFFTKEIVCNRKSPTNVHLKNDLWVRFRNNTRREHLFRWSPSSLFIFSFFNINWKRSRSRNVVAVRIKWRSIGTARLIFAVFSTKTTLFIRLHHLRIYFAIGNSLHTYINI